MKKAVLTAFVLALFVGGRMQAAAFHGPIGDPGGDENFTFHGPIGDPGGPTHDPDAGIPEDLIRRARRECGKGGRVEPAVDSSLAIR